jgi:hypothetical protein
MAAEQEEWLKQAYEIYRQAWASLERWKGKPPEDSELGFYIEEMKEALLDLKQATISRDPSRAAESEDEVKAILIEILSRSAGDE